MSDPLVYLVVGQIVAICLLLRLLRRKSLQNQQNEEILALLRGNAEVSVASNKSAKRALDRIEQQAASLAAPAVLEAVEKVPEKTATATAEKVVEVLTGSGTYPRPSGGGT